MRAMRGFTLMEVLIVLALVGIVAGLVVVRLDDDGQRATRHAAERLSLALEAARDEAIYSGREVAFSSDGDAWQFWRGDAGRRSWQAMADGEMLRPRRLGNNVRIVSQEVSGRNRPLGERLVFAAYGLSEPFTLLLQGGHTRISIRLDAMGRVSLDTLENADTP
ncbi:MAG: type II secretion system protein GspH [Candidatus Dactylopiibacterium carminicum]|nr:GspH/FimT family pseudopilin [Candidatus Dactylopiibacterium carminicum]PAS98570.1 MAG: type II secretion system protein GspH [Candidatus Dactylopiibacterium carminicum]